MNQDNKDEATGKVVWGELNQQTAQIEWAELERHFAKGVLIWLSPDQDLVEIAVQLVRDRAGEIGPLIEEGKIVRATDDHARDWSERNPVLWTVVAAPWVLVQEKV